MWRTDSFEKPWCWERLKVGREGSNRGWDGWMTSLPRWAWVWVNSGAGDGRGGLVCCSSWGRKESDTTERLSWNWSLFAQQLKITMNETLGLIMIHVGKISSVSYQNSWKKLQRSSSLWILYSYQSISGVTFVLGTVVDGDS